MIQICATLTDADIVDNMIDVSEDEEAERHTYDAKVRTKEAEKAVQPLTVFLNLRKMLDTKYLELLLTLEG